MFQGLPLPVWAKFTFCVVADLFDLTVGRLLLGYGILTDVGNALIMFLLWGPLGLLAIVEAIDVTEQIDGFIPTNTIIAWRAHKRLVAQGIGGAQ